MGNVGLDRARPGWGVADGWGHGRGFQGQVRFPARRSGQAVCRGQAPHDQGFRRTGQALGRRQAAHKRQAETLRQTETREPAANAGQAHLTGQGRADRQNRHRRRDGASRPPPRPRPPSRTTGRRYRALMNNSQPMAPSRTTMTSQPMRGPNGQRAPSGGRAGPLLGDVARNHWISVHTC